MSTCYECGHKLHASKPREPSKEHYSGCLYHVHNVAMREKLILRAEGPVLFPLTLARIKEAVAEMNATVDVTKLITLNGHTLLNVHDDLAPYDISYSNGIYQIEARDVRMHIDRKCGPYASWELARDQQVVDMSATLHGEHVRFRGLVKETHERAINYDTSLVVSFTFVGQKT